MNEYNSNFKEFSEVENEFAAYTDTEFAKPVCEILDCGDEFNNDATMTSNDTKKQAGKRKLLRKISYLVTACVAVVVMGRTLEPVYTYEEDVDKFGGDDMEQSDLDNVETYISELSTLPKWTHGGRINIANGGVICFSDSYGKVGLADYKGNILLEPSDLYLLCGPNDDGYTILGNDENTYLYDSNGDLCFAMPVDKCGNLMSMGEDNIMVTSYHDENGDSGVLYVYPDGTILYDTGYVKETDCYGIPFRDGKAYFCKAEPWSTEVYELTKDGNVKLIDKVDDLQSDIDGLLGVAVDGYYVCEMKKINSDGNGYTSGYCLVQPSTGRKTELISIICGALQSYETNGGLAYNSGTYGTFRTGTGIIDNIEIVGHEKEFLFDYNDEFFFDFRTNEVGGYIAAYDEIYLTDFPVILVQDNNKFFYINREGNPVSEKYDFASIFNRYGYAVVRKDISDDWQIINSDFEIVHTFQEGQPYNPGPWAGTNHIYDVGDNIFIIEGRETEDSGLEMYIFLFEP